MIEQYLQQLIENCKNCSVTAPENMIFPIKPQDFPFADMDSNFRTAQDYNYTLYSSSEIPSTFQQSPIINEGNLYIYKNVSHSIILGMHNIGKTAFLKNLAYHYAKDYSGPNSPVPVLKTIEELQIASRKSLKSSIFEGIEAKKIVLLVDGMTSQLKKYQRVFIKQHKCIFVSSFKQFTHLPEFQVFTLEPFPVSLQILRAQGCLPANKYLEFMERALQKTSQIAEFCKFPQFLTFFLTYFDEMKNKKRGLLYTAYIQSIIKDKDAWNDLQTIALEILDSDLNVFGFQEIRNLGLHKCWNMMQEMDLFKKTNPFLSISDITCSDIENEYITGPDMYIKDSITEFSITADCHILTLSHIRLIETLAAHHLVNRFEDFLANTHKSTYIESQEFAKILSRLFPANFFYCKKYQEVLLLFSQLCEDSLFENLVKFILSNPCIENCFIAEKILAENSAPEFQHLKNGVDAMKQEIINKEFIQGLTHCSGIIRNLCRNQVLKVNPEAFKLIVGNLKSVVGSCNWYVLHSMKNLADLTDLKHLISAIEQNLTDLLFSVSKKLAYSSTHCNYLLKFLVSTFEANKSMANTTQNPGKFDDFFLEDTYKSNLDISTKKLKLFEFIKFNQLIKLLLEALIKLKGLSLKYAIKSLLYLNAKKRKIRNCLIERVKIMNNSKVGKILHYLMLLRVKDEESFRFVMSYYGDKECKKRVKLILAGLRKSWVKKMAFWMLQSQANEAIAAFGFCFDGVDMEILEVLLQYIDNSDLHLSLMGSESLYYILKDFPQTPSYTVMHLLRTLSEILNEKLRITKQYPGICIKFLKCELKALKILGEHKKIICIACEFLSTSDNQMISAIYNLLLKLNISYKYFEKLKPFFDDCKFGQNGKFLLKIASLHLSWRNELSMLRIIADSSGRFPERNVADLLVQWDCVDFLQMFCNTDGIAYLPRLKKILNFIENTEEKLTVFESISEFVAKISEDFSNYQNEFGICCFEAVVCYGKCNDSIEDWAIQYMQKCEDTTELINVSGIYAMIVKNTMISRKFERKLLKLLPASPITVITVSKNIRLQSDEIILQLIPMFLNSSVDISLFPDTVLQLAQKKSSNFLVSLHKLIYYSSNNSEFNYSLHKFLEKTIDNLTINNDFELDAFVEAACKSNCGIFFDHIWKYIIKKLRVNPRFYLTYFCENMLKSSIAWDSRFTLKYCKILGLFRHRISFEENSNLITQDDV